MPPMGRASTIPIQPLPGLSPAGCGHCHHTAGDAGCLSTPPGVACAATQLSGPADQLARVMGALGQRLGFAPEAPEQAGVRALRITPDEVELELAWSPRCGGADFAETAFDTLRGLLPDTDIYVTHPR